MKRPQSEYITLDCLFKKWKAFIFSRRHVYGRHRYFYQIVDARGLTFSRHCETFSDWVDLHTKQSHIYKAY